MPWLYSVLVYGLLGPLVGVTLVVRSELAGEGSSLLPRAALAQQDSRPSLQVRLSRGFNLARQGPPNSFL